MVFINCSICNIYGNNPHDIHYTAVIEPEDETDSLVYTFIWAPVRGQIDNMAKHICSWTLLLVTWKWKRYLVREHHQGLTSHPASSTLCLLHTIVINKKKSCPKSVILQTKSRFKGVHLVMSSLLDRAAKFRPPLNNWADKTKNTLLMLICEVHWDWKLD